MSGPITPSQRQVVRFIQDFAPRTFEALQAKAQWEGMTFFTVLDGWPAFIDDAHAEIKARREASDRLLVAADDAADFFRKLGKTEYADGLARECALLRRLK